MEKVQVCRYCHIARVLLLLHSFLQAAAVSAQGTQGTAHQGIRLKAYGMFSSVQPDFRSSGRNSGATVGGDIDGFRLLPHTDLGLDIRYTTSSGVIESQRFLGGGPRVSLNIAAFKPYGDFLFGRGRSTFNTGDPTYTHDETGVIAYGGGFDYRVSRYWSVRADAQRQRWRFSVQQPYFYPVAASVGLSYQIHFHSRTGPNL